MKKKFKQIIVLILAILLLLSNFNTSNAEEKEEVTRQIEYTETLESFDNPERGFYSPVFIRYKEDNNEVVKIRNNLAHLRLDIGAFSKAINGKEDIPLTQNMLDAFDQTLKTLKSNGGTAIVRFAYTYEGEKNKEPSIDMILKHIEQVGSVLTQNQEVIAYVELGFFGPWGEMHSSNVCTTENVCKAINVMLENTPKEMKIGVRQPGYYAAWVGVDRAKLDENVTEEGTNEYRIGLYNDGYLGSESDLGTFRNRKVEIKWLEKQAMHTLYGGEVVANAASGTPLNTTEYISKEGFRTHTTYLNIAWNNKVIDSWRNEEYNGEDTLYQGQTGFTYISNHLGYRFVVRKAEFQDELKQNEKLKINLDVENVGFGNLINEKVVSIVFAKGDEIYEIKTNLDATGWNSKEITNINFEEELPQEISDGKWDVYLRISEYGDLKTDNNYKAIRLANNGNVWNKEIGANYIGSFNIISEETENELKATKLGIGGGGALFEPAISPFDSNEMLVVPDMGGIYISHNKGEHWDRVNMYGTVISATYDPNREGVIYAGGSGLYRSTDNGNTFELIFPRKDDIIARLTHNENGLQYYFTYSGLYDRNKYVKNILIDPEDSNHIFILSYSYKKGKVLESTDNGENFKEIFEYEKSTSPSVQFDFNELIYKKETKEIFVINDENIIGYNLESRKQSSEYNSKLGFVDVATVYENDKTYFIIIEKTDELNNSDTKVYYTNNFVDKVDITNELTSVQPTTFHNNTYGDVTYKYNFSYISATSLNNIYITNWSYQQSSSIKKYPYTIDGIIRYKNGKAEYLYGNPFKDHNTLSSRAWCDGNTYSLGISASKQNEDEFIFTTLCGVYYSPDNTHIYPRYSTVTEGAYPNAKYVTSGIDEQATYGVYEDPFHEGVLLLLNTDLGLIRSEDNGQSWERAINGIPNKWVNTVYDAAFDERRENIVYSLWSGRHNAPYSAGNETDGRYGGFAISTDGGKTWDTNYSSGLPENTIPVKMSVIYQDDSEEVTIYVATFNEGFFVSYDSGKTFEEMNNGIERIHYKEEEKYKYIFASDIEVKEGHIFGITAKTSYNGETQSGELYEYIDGKWEKIELPVNVRTPKDILYKDNVLYISGTATAVWNYKNGTDFNNYGGGVYTYENGHFTQIFDESISTTSVQIDSKGTLYVSDINGHIYRKEKDKDYQKIYDNYFYISKGLQISSDDDYLYLASFGGGLLKLENLNSLYSHSCSGGTATCTKKAVCEVCGEEYGELDKNNHSKETTHKENAKKATCTEEGYTGDTVYDCCNQVKEKGTKIEKLEHKYDEGKITKEATYEEEGEKTYICQVCNETKIEKIPKLEKEEHTKHSGGTATCTKKAVCEVCGEEYGELDKNNHSKETTHKENAKKATCTEEGYTGDTVYDCCNQVKEKGTKIEKLEHKYDEGKITKEATYEEEGEKTYICQVCNETKIERIPKLEKEEHTKHSGGTATCTKKAACEVCGEEYGELDKNNHSKETTHKENAKKATCTEEGYTGDTVYDCCKQVKEKGSKIEKLEHKYDEGKITKEATYEEEGEKTYTCQVCSETKIERIPKLEKEEHTKHSGGTATCTKKAVCEVCGEEYGELDKNNHSKETTHKENAKKATCTEEGYTGDTVYDCCNQVKEKGTKIEKLEHKYDEGKITKEATYEEEGEKTYICQACNETKIERIPKLEKENISNNTNSSNENVSNKNEINTSNETKNNTSNKNETSILKKNTVDSSNKNNTKDNIAKNELPYAGKPVTIGLFITVLVLTILAIYSKIKLNKYKK